MKSSDEWGRCIVAEARRFVNLWETRQNTVWDDPSTPEKDARAIELVKVLKSAGHEDGWAYCMSFCEGIWRLTYGDSLPIKIARALTPHVMTSFHAIDAMGLVSHTPKPGAIFFMQMGNSSRGHAGIVDRPLDGYFKTIEGNTSPKAGTPEREREGDGIFEKQKRLDFTQKSGLWLRGFLSPIPA